MLSRFVIVFLPRNKCLLISWLQSASTVILKPKKIKSVTVSTVSMSIRHEVMGLDAMILVFLMLNFKPAFSCSSFTFIKRLFSSSCFLPLDWYHLHIWGCWYFSQQSCFQLVSHPAHISELVFSSISVSFFLICYMHSSVVIFRLSFSVWHFTKHNTFSRFILVVANGRISFFLWLSTIYLIYIYVSIYTIFYIYRYIYMYNFYPFIYWWSQLL